LVNLTLENGFASIGGAVNTSGTFSATGCTFEHNSTSNDGGAIIVVKGTAAIKNCTFVDNFGTTGAVGGAIGTAVTTTRAVVNSTFQHNTAAAGGGTFYFAGSLTVANSIITQSGGPNGSCSGAVTDGGFNIADDATCGFGTTAGANGLAIGDSVQPFLLGL